LNFDQVQGFADEGRVLSQAEEEKLLAEA
jgi:hypothetical protein